MTKANKEMLLNRLKSLLWRLFMMATAAGVNFLAENLGLFNLSPELVIVIGLGLGEVSKYLNSKTR